MKTLSAVLVLASSLGAFAQDWPQWRGANRDARASNFKAPEKWPEQLTQKWKVPVGDGVATPALVGDRLYVFSREQGSEVIRALSAADGKELWVDKYESLGASGPAQSFSGPRSSPAVANGKVVTVGVRGMVSCLDSANGKVLWRKDEFKAYPNFHPSSSPMIVGNLAVAQLGGRENGAVVAYDLTSGEQEWKWSGPSPSYASPVVMTLNGKKYVVAQTESQLVVLDAVNGQLAWESAGTAPGGGAGPGGGRGGGGGRDYKASTPLVEGNTLITAGRGIKAMKLEKDGDKLAAKELWSNPDKSVQFNSPTLKNGLLYGLAGNNELFCIDAKDGKTLWSAPFPGGAPAGRADLNLRATSSAVVGLPQDAPTQAQPADQERRRPGGQGPGGQGGGRRGGGMGGGGGYGTIVDAGPVLFALTPGGQLIVFEAGAKEFKQLASYKVGTQTHAYPVASGNRVFVKDRDSVTLWTVE